MTDAIQGGFRQAASQIRVGNQQRMWWTKKREPRPFEGPTDHGTKTRLISPDAVAVVKARMTGRTVFGNWVKGIRPLQPQLPLTHGMRDSVHGPKDISFS